MLATVLMALGRPEEAEIHLRKGLAMFVEAGDISALPLHVSDFVQLALARDQFDRALVLAGAASALQTFSQTRLLDLVSTTSGDSIERSRALEENEPRNSPQRARR